jgi:hypothetical protein
MDVIERAVARLRACDDILGMPAAAPQTMDFVRGSDKQMQDFWFLVVVLAFFALCAAYTDACERM